MTIKISEARLLNVRAWAEARLADLSGAAVIVAAIDEVIESRREGFVLVPREPTPDMITAGAMAIDEATGLDCVTAVEAWKAMVNAGE